MNINSKLLSATSATCILAAASVLSIVYLFSTNTSNYEAYAQQYTATPSSPIQNTSSNDNILSTLGTATAKVKPDKVTLVLGVETTNKTADAISSYSS